MNTYPVKLACFTFLLELANHSFYFFPSEVVNIGSGV